MVELDLAAITDQVEAVLYAENHATLCGCKHWPDGCVNGLVPAFTLSAEDVLRVGAPLIAARVAEETAERIARAIETAARYRCPTCGDPLHYCDGRKEGDAQGAAGETDGWKESDAVEVAGLCQEEVWKELAVRDWGAWEGADLAVGRTDRDYACSTRREEESAELPGMWEAADSVGGRTDCGCSCSTWREETPFGFSTLLGRDAACSVHGCAPTPRADDRARYPHARCGMPGLHIDHTWGDPLHYCDGREAVLGGGV